MDYQSEMHCGQYRMIEETIVSTLLVQNHCNYHLFLLLIIIQPLCGARVFVHLLMFMDTFIPFYTIYEPHLNSGSRSSWSYVETLWVCVCDVCVCMLSTEKVFSHFF